MPRKLAGFIARFTSTANLGPLTVNRAGRRHADLTNQCGATIAVALHASKMTVGKRAGDAIEIAIVLGRKSGPVVRKRTASAQLRQSAAASGDLAAMRSLLVVNSCTPLPVTRLLASAEFSLGCLPTSTTLRRETLITSGWNRQSGDISAPSLRADHPPMAAQAARG
jgi:hypothetical protein